MDKKVFVKVEGGKSYGIEDNTYSWSGEEVDILFVAATNFADGYTSALMARGFNFGRPMVMQLDGYWWRHGTMTVKVVNEKGKIIRKEEDI